MRRIPYYILDVFTDRQLGGNPLAVYPDRSLLHENELQKIAAEMNLSETVFVEPPRAEGALRRLRIFTPKKELPLAGHPVVGTWYLLASRGLVDLEAAVEAKQAYVVRHENMPDKIIIRHELGVGVLPVTIFREKEEIGGVVMDQAKPEYGEEIRDISAIAAALGLEKQSITASFTLPRAVSTGIRWLITPLANRNALERIELDTQQCIEVSRAHDCVGIYAFTRDAEQDSDMAFVSARGFVPLLGIHEDPATGSAAGCLGAYLAKTRVVKAKQMVAFQVEQGVDMGRPSRIAVEVSFVDEEVERVRVGGGVVVTAEGTLLLP
jgi:trans-2,3-dihydro-3-hydroxyanthranilate isomerase